MQPFIQSETSIAWTATLLPFVPELPGDCDWVDFVRTENPTKDAAEIARRWSRTDKRNPALQHSLPVEFVRSAVITHANRDLVNAAHAGTALTLDSLHQQVVARRFDDDDDQGWRAHGFAVPILFPDVAELDWAGIAELRRTRQMSAFRAVMREVEAEALLEAAGGDLEGAAHHVYERYLGAAIGHVEGLGSALRRTGLGFVLGGATGLVTAGLAGPVSIVAGAALGTGITSIGDIRSVLRARRRRGWVIVHNRLTEVP
jgi:hypothetical protein